MAQKKRSTSFKAWSMSRRPRLLIWPFTKTLGGAFVHSCYPGGRKFEQTNFQKFKCTGSCRRECYRCITRKMSLKMIIVMIKVIIIIIITMTEHGQNLWFLIINLILMGVNVTYQWLVHLQKCNSKINWDKNNSFKTGLTLLLSFFITISFLG